MKGLLAAFTGFSPAQTPGAFSWKGFFWKTFIAPHLATGATSTDAQKEAAQAAYDAAAKAVGIIETVLWIVIGVVGLAAVIYAIYLGFNLARASEQGKRDEAKKHLITVVIAIVVTLVLVIFFLYLLPGILGAFKNVKLN